MRRKSKSHGESQRGDTDDAVPYEPIDDGLDPCRQILNHKLDDEFMVEGYSIVWPLFILMVVLCVLTCGVLALVFYWMQHWFLYTTHKRCPLWSATRVLILAKYNTKVVVHVYVMDFTTRTIGKASKLDSDTDTVSWKAGTYQVDSSDAVISDNPSKTQSSWPQRLRHFKHQDLMYYWNGTEKKFQRLWGLEHDSTASKLHTLRGLTSAEYSLKSFLYGLNYIDVKITPILVLLIREVLTPFVIFQIFSLVVWGISEYYSYTTTIFLLSVASMVLTLIQTRKMQRSLKERVDGVTEVSVFRGDQGKITTLSDSLVPGDVIEIPREGCLLQYDAILLHGDVVVNESMLTGESIPAIKTPLPNPVAIGHPDLLYTIKDHSRHTLFCGTQVLQARCPRSESIRAVVVRTGFSTLKGELVRAIQYAKPVDFHFNRHALGYIGFLGLFAIGAFVYTMVVKLSRGRPMREAIVRGLEILTLPVPPQLSVAMMFGIMFAQYHLRRQQVYCTKPASITVAGCIKVCVFDKTGTLTKEDIDLAAVVPAQDGKFAAPAREVSELASEMVKAAMASCHSLIRIDNALRGDPLELKMLEWSLWQMEEHLDVHE